MNDYLKIRDLIKKYKCGVCCGVGSINDAEPGDITLNTRVCTKCGGTGLLKTPLQIAALIRRFK